MYNLNELSKQAYEIAKSKGFHDNPVEMGTRLMLIVSELGEALEADRNNKFTNPIADEETGQTTCEWIANTTSDDRFKPRFVLQIKDTFEDEIADTFIRLFDLCGYLNIDIDKHVALKMRYNSLREHKHGKEY